MNKKLQVFVSSTYTDLIAERQSAVEAILSAGHIPAGMELFAAGNEEQMKVIRDWIDDSDVYMLILGGRYGSVEKKSSKSYTQLEYEYAVEKSKPLFAVYMTDDYFERKVKSEGSAVTEQNDSASLKSFRATVLGRMCKSFDTLDGLQVAVHQSLGRFARDETLVGWVKGNEVVDAKKTLDQITRLQTENDQLKAEVEELRAASALQEKPHLRDVLSDDAKKLLLAAAAKDGNRIVYYRYMGGASIQAGVENFINPQNDEREHSRWKAALEELVHHRLIEDEGYKREVFRLTKMGYEVADEIMGMNPKNKEANQV